MKRFKSSCHAILIVYDPNTLYRYDNGLCKCKTCLGNQFVRAIIIYVSRGDLYLFWHVSFLVLQLI